MSFLGLMTVRAHEAVVKEKSDVIARLVEQKREYKALAGTSRSLKIEMAALRDDRDALAAQLAHWKKHGQLRDPATGRLIPKPKPSDRFTASHTPT